MSSFPVAMTLPRRRRLSLSLSLSLSLFVVLSLIYLRKKKAVKEATTSHETEPSRSVVKSITIIDLSTWCVCVCVGVKPHKDDEKKTKNKHLARRPQWSQLRSSFVFTFRRFTQSESKKKQTKKNNPTTTKQNRCGRSAKQ